MHWALLISCALSLSSCGEEPKRSVIIDGDPVLVSYVSRFMVDAESIGREVTLCDMRLSYGITASKEAPNRIGYCFYGTPREIVIDPIWFEKANEADREALMYHEFGHCILNLPHEDECLAVSGTSCVQPKSLMYPSLITGVYGENKAWYLQELFQTRSK